MLIHAKCQNVHHIQIVYVKLINVLMKNVWQGTFLFSLMSQVSVVSKDCHFERYYFECCSKEILVLFKQMLVLVTVMLLAGSLTKRQNDVNNSYILDAMGIEIIF